MSMAGSLTSEFERQHVVFKKPPPPPPPLPPPPDHRPMSMSTFRPPVFTPNPSVPTVDHPDIIIETANSAGSGSQHQVITEKQGELLRAKSLHHRQRNQHVIDQGFSYISTLKKRQAQQCLQSEAEEDNDKTPLHGFGTPTRIDQNRRSRMLLSNMKPPKFAAAPDQHSPQEPHSHQPVHTSEKSHGVCWIITVVLLIILLLGAIAVIAVLLVRDSTAAPPQVFITNSMGPTKSEKLPAAGEEFFESHNQLPAMLSRERLPETTSSYTLLTKIKLDTLDVDQRWKHLKAPESKSFARQLENLLVDGLKRAPLTEGDVRTVRVDNVDPEKQEVYLTVVMDRPHFTNHVNHDIIKIVERNNGYLLGHKVDVNKIRTTDSFDVEGVLDLMTRDPKDIEESRVGMELIHLIRSSASLHEVTKKVSVRDFFQKSQHVLHVTYRSVFNQIISLRTLRTEVRKQIIMDGSKLGPYDVSIDSIHFKDVSVWSNPREEPPTATPVPTPVPLPPTEPPPATTASTPGVIMAVMTRTTEMPPQGGQELFRANDTHATISANQTPAVHQDSSQTPFGEPASTSSPILVQGGHHEGVETLEKQATAFEVPPLLQSDLGGGAINGSNEHLANSSDGANRQGSVDGRGVDASLPESTTASSARFSHAPEESQESGAIVLGQTNASLLEVPAASHESVVTELPPSTTHQPFDFTEHNLDFHQPEQNMGRSGLEDLSDPVVHNSTEDGSDERAAVPGGFPLQSNTTHLSLLDDLTIIKLSEEVDTVVIVNSAIPANTSASDTASGKFSPTEDVSANFTTPSLNSSSVQGGLPEQKFLEVGNSTKSASLSGSEFDQSAQDSTTVSPEKLKTPLEKIKDKFEDFGKDTKDELKKLKTKMKDVFLSHKSPSKDEKDEPAPTSVDEVVVSLNGTVADPNGTVPEDVKKKLEEGAASEPELTILLPPDNSTLNGTRDVHLNRTHELTAPSETHFSVLPRNVSAGNSTSPSHHSLSEQGAASEPTAVTVKPPSLNNTHINGSKMATEKDAGTESPGFPGNFSAHQGLPGTDGSPNATQKVNSTGTELGAASEKHTTVVLPPSNASLLNTTRQLNASDSHGHGELTSASDVKPVVVKAPGNVTVSNTTSPRVSNSTADHHGKEEVAASEMDVITLKGNVSLSNASLAHHGHGVGERTKAANATGHSFEVSPASTNATTSNDTLHVGGNATAKKNELGSASEKHESITSPDDLLIPHHLHGEKEEGAASEPNTTFVPPPNDAKADLQQNSTDGKKEITAASEVDFETIPPAVDKETAQGSATFLFGEGSGADPFLSSEVLKTGHPSNGPATGATLSGPTPSENRDIKSPTEFRPQMSTPTGVDSTSTTAGRVDPTSSTTVAPMPPSVRNGTFLRKAFDGEARDPALTDELLKSILATGSGQAPSPGTSDIQPPDLSGPTVKDSPGQSPVDSTTGGEQLSAFLEPPPPPPGFSSGSTENVKTSDSAVRAELPTFLEPPPPQSTLPSTGDGLRSEPAGQIQLPTRLEPPPIRTPAADGGEGVRADQGQLSTSQAPPPAATSVPIAPSGVKTEPPSQQIPATSPPVLPTQPVTIAPSVVGPTKAPLIFRGGQVSVRGNVSTGSQIVGVRTNSPSGVPENPGLNSLDQRFLEAILGTGRNDSTGNQNTFMPDPAVLQSHPEGVENKGLAQRVTPVQQAIKDGSSQNASASVGGVQTSSQFVPFSPSGTDPGRVPSSEQAPTAMVDNGSNNGFKVGATSMAPSSASGVGFQPPQRVTPNERIPIRRPADSPWYKYQQRPVISGRADSNGLDLAQQPGPTFGRPVDTYSGRPSASGMDPSSRTSSYPSGVGKFASVPSASLVGPQPLKEGYIIDTFTFEATIGGGVKMLGDSPSAPGAGSGKTGPGGIRGSVPPAGKGTKPGEVFRPKLFLTMPEDGKEQQRDSRIAAAPFGMRSQPGVVGPPSQGTPGQTGSQFQPAAAPSAADELSNRGSQFRPPGATTTQQFGGFQPSAASFGQQASRQQDGQFIQPQFTQTRQDMVFTPQQLASSFPPQMFVPRMPMQPNFWSGTDPGKAADLQGQFPSVAGLEQNLQRPVRSKEQFGSQIASDTPSEMTQNSSTRSWLTSIETKTTNAVPDEWTGSTEHPTGLKVVSREGRKRKSIRPVSKKRLRKIERQLARMSKVKMALKSIEKRSVDPDPSLDLFICPKDFDVNKRVYSREVWLACKLNIRTKRLDRNPQPPRRWSTFETIPLTIQLTLGGEILPTAANVDSVNAVALVNGHRQERSAPSPLVHHFKKWQTREDTDRGQQTALSEVEQYKPKQPKVFRLFRTAHPQAPLPGIEDNSWSSQLPGRKLMAIPDREKRLVDPNRRPPSHPLRHLNRRARMPPCPRDFIFNKQAYGPNVWLACGAISHDTYRRHFGIINRLYNQGQIGRNNPRVSAVAPRKATPVLAELPSTRLLEAAHAASNPNQASLSTNPYTVNGEVYWRPGEAVVFACPKDVNTNPTKYGEFITTWCLGGPPSHPKMSFPEPTERQCRREIVPNELMYPDELVGLCRTKYTLKESTEMSFAPTINQGRVADMGMKETYSGIREHEDENACTNAINVLEAIQLTISEQNVPQCLTRMSHVLEQALMALSETDTGLVLQALKLGRDSSRKTVGQKSPDERGNALSNDQISKQKVPTEKKQAQEEINGFARTLANWQPNVILAPPLVLPSDGESTPSAVVRPETVVKPQAVMKPFTIQEKQTQQAGSPKAGSVLGSPQQPVVSAQDQNVPGPLRPPQPTHFPTNLPSFAGSMSSLPKYGGYFSQALPALRLDSTSSNAAWKPFQVAEQKPENGNASPASEYPQPKSNSVDLGADENRETSRTSTNAAVDGKATIAARPIPVYKPSAEAKPIPAFIPTSEAKPIPASETKPIPAFIPASETKPIPAFKPASEPKPIPAFKPASEPKPIPASKPVDGAKPIPAGESSAGPVPGRVKPSSVSNMEPTFDQLLSKLWTTEEIAAKNRHYSDAKAEVQQTQVKTIYGLFLDLLKQDQSLGQEKALGEASASRLSSVPSTRVKLEKDDRGQEYKQQSTWEHTVNVLQEHIDPDTSVVVPSELPKLPRMKLLPTAEAITLGKLPDECYLTTDDDSCIRAQEVKQLAESVFGGANHRSQTGGSYIKLELLEKIHEAHRNRTGLAKLEEIVRAITSNEPVASEKSTVDVKTNYIAGPKTVKRCNGILEGPGGHDEIGCTCRERVDVVESGSYIARDKSRTCDTIHDCHDLDDEKGCCYCVGEGMKKDCPKERLGCFQCARDEMMCIDKDDTSPKQDTNCFKKEEWCDGVQRCKNGHDESDTSCFMLETHPDQHKRIYGVKGKGHLYRRIKGAWYMVCHTRLDERQIFDKEASALCRDVMGHPTGENSVTVGGVPRYLQRLSSHKFATQNADGQWVVANTCWGMVVHVTCENAKCGQTTLARRKRIIPRNDDVASFDTYESYGNNSNTWGEDDTPERIVGGVEAPAGAYPHLCAVWHNQFYACGASVLTEQYLLTAAHCFYVWSSATKVISYQNTMYRVVCGSIRRFSRSPWEQMVHVDYVISHPDYSGAKSQKHHFENDIAVIAVAPKLFFNRRVQPICLPPPYHRPPSGTKTIVAGWGHTTYQGASPDHCYEVQVPLIDKCSSIADMNYVKDDKMMCAGWLGVGGKDACSGDSGGPLMAYDAESEGQLQLIGVVSHGRMCALKNYPGVYTCVSYYRQWIDSVLAGKFGYRESKYKALDKCPGVQCNLSPTCAYQTEMCDKKVHCLWDRLPADEFSSCGIKHETDEVSEYSNTQTPLIVANQNTHCFPGSFQCKRDKTCIPEKQLCDGTPQCADGSDEHGCKCGDYAKKIASLSSLVCDNVRHCYDSSDESVCNNVEDEDQMTCSRSKDLVKVSKSQWCDAKSDCPNLEDEKRCYILGDVSQVEYNELLKPVTRRKGKVLAWKQPNDWVVACFKKFTSAMADSLCSYLGFQPARSHSFSAPRPQNNGRCSAEVECGPPLCGKRRYLRHEENGDPPSYDVDEYAKPGSWPWYCQVYISGSFSCGASLILDKWLIAPASCLESVYATKTANVRVRCGVWNMKLPLKNAHEQLLKIDAYKVLPDAGAVLLRMSEEPRHSDTVVPVCLPSMPVTLGPEDRCFVSGWVKGKLETIPVRTAECGPGKLCLNYLEDEDRGCALTWGGTVNCPIKNSDGVSWQAVAVFSVTGTCDDQQLPQELPALSLRYRDILHVTSGRNPVEKLSDKQCNGEVMGYGTCVPLKNMNDGVVQSYDMEDERVISAERSSINEILCSEDDRGYCVCPSEDHFMCGSGECIDVSLRCDPTGVAHCLDKSDLKDCQCAEKIKNGTWPGVLCDCNEDCPFGEDESEEVCNVPAHHFRCCNNPNNRERQTESVSLLRVGDGRKDCANGEDEDPLMKFALSEGSHVNTDRFGRPYILKNGIFSIRQKGVFVPQCAEDFKPETGDQVCWLWKFSGMVKYETVAYPPAHASLAEEYFAVVELLAKPFCDVVWIYCEV